MSELLIRSTAACQTSQEKGRRGGKGSTKVLFGAQAMAKALLKSCSSYLPFSASPVRFSSRHPWH